MNYGIAETVNASKALCLSEYDLQRKPHKAVTDSSEITISTRLLSAELCCPICLDLLTVTMATKECLHRFCCECITTALLRGNKECPTCRKKLVSKRSLRPDPNLDALINKIWPDRQAYDLMQQKAMDMFHQQCNVGALQQGIQAGLRAQAVNRRRRIQGSHTKRKKEIFLKRNFATISTKFPHQGAKRLIIFGKKVRLRAGHQDRSNNSSPETNSNGSGEEAEMEIDDESDRLEEVSADGQGAPSACDTLSDCAEGRNSNIKLSAYAPSHEIEDYSVPSVSTESYRSGRNNEDHRQSCISPVNVFTLKDRMQKWLEENPSSPSTPDDNVAFHLRRKGDDDTLMMELDDTLFYNEKMDFEVELIPMKSIFERINIPHFLLNHHYIRSKGDTTLNHIGEYLYQMWSEELRDFEEKSKMHQRKALDSCHSSSLSNHSHPAYCVQHPSQFYTLNSADSRLIKISSNQTLLEASRVQKGGCHLMLYFDVDAFC